MVEKIREEKKKSHKNPEQYMTDNSPLNNWIVYINLSRLDLNIVEKKKCSAVIWTLSTL